MSKKILAVDDEQDILWLVKTSLEGEGYTVLTASDGKQALELIGQEKPDLVVLDVLMPEMNGYQVLKTIKDNPATAHIPVMMLTAQDQDANVLAGRITWDAIGADLYLSKPFEALTLMTSVKRFFKEN